MTLVEGVQAQIENTFALRANFSSIRTLVQKVMESCVKYSDYLIANKSLQDGYRSVYDEEPVYQKYVFELPFSSLQNFKIHREKNAIEAILEILNNSDFYVRVCIDDHFHEKRSYRYTFYKRLKDLGFPLSNVVVFAQYYRGSKGNVYS